MQTWQNLQFMNKISDGRRAHSQFAIRAPENLSFSSSINASRPIFEKIPLIRREINGCPLTPIIVNFAPPFQRFRNLFEGTQRPHSLARNFILTRTFLLCRNLQLPRSIIVCVEVGKFSYNSIAEMPNQ